VGRGRGGGWSGGGGGDRGGAPAAMRHYPALRSTSPCRGYWTAGPATASSACTWGLGATAPASPKILMPGEGRGARQRPPTHPRSVCARVRAARMPKHPSARIQVIEAARAAGLDWVPSRSGPRWVCSAAIWPPPLVARMAVCRALREQRPGVQAIGRISALH
jgi:hypothetical protein